MCDKKMVYELYFKNHKKVVEIAEELGISQPAVTKILKQFPEYEREKEQRKRENQMKHKDRTIQYIKEKRNKEKGINEEEEALLAGMRLLQAQSAAEMSKKRRITNEGIVTILIHHYDYDKDRKVLKFNENCGSKPNDVPEKFAVRI